MAQDQEKAATESLPSAVDGLNVNEETGDSEDLVTPWEVKTTSAKGVDYDKLIGEYSTLTKLRVSNIYIRRLHHANFLILKFRNSVSIFLFKCLLKIPTLRNINNDINRKTFLCFLCEDEGNSHSKLLF